MKKLGLLLILFFSIIIIKAQNIDDFVGNWFKQSIHEININDSVEFFKMDIDSSQVHFYAWNFDVNMKYEQVLAFPIEEPNDTMYIVRNYFDLDWAFDKKTSELVLGEEYYKVLHVDSSQLKVVRTK